MYIHLKHIKVYLLENKKTIEELYEEKRTNGCGKQFLWKAVFLNSKTYRYKKDRRTFEE